MLKRENLETMAMDWCTGEDEGADGDGGPFLYAPEMEGEVGMKLAAAAPALALACLLADEYADIMERGEQVRMAETCRLRKALRQALTAAGVAIADRDGEEPAQESLATSEVAKGPPAVVDLMAALRASLAAAGPKR